MLKNLASSRALVALVLFSSLGGCGNQSTVQERADAPPLFDGMGQHHRAVTTSSPLAQRYFDQGLVWAYAFNHDEAIRSFRHAARLDPECAMAYWGVALCNGPHINYPLVPPDRAAAAWDALQKALALKEKASPIERKLIEALAHRYADPQPADRKPLDQAYADAMREIWEAHPDDSDVGTLYAEAMMDLRPWDLWKESGEPQPGTQEILRVLEHVQKIDPMSPGANHLYIHAVESSPDPERAIAAADRLRNMVPASGHLLHMPSHIDVLVGRWADAAAQNELAIEADRRYRKLSPRQGFYSLYMLHDHHMLSFIAMMEGRSTVAEAAARRAVESVPEDYMRENAALVDPYMGAVYDALKRFGRWDDLLKEPAPPSCLPITTAMWRFSRGIAYAAKGEVSLARQEQRAFEQAVAVVPDDALMAISPAHRVLGIADHMLEGEIAYRRGDIDHAVAELRKAIELEDQLLYMEPPEWMQPMRHTLGAVLLSAGRHKEAEQAYRQDLKHWKENGWSLYGISRCLRAGGASEEAAAYEARFRKAWSRSDTPIGSSCMCVPKT